MEFGPTFPLSSIFPSNSKASNSLVWNWVVETLTEIKEVDTPMLQVPTAVGVPDFMSSSLRSMKLRIALKCLKEWVDAQCPCQPLPPCIPQLLLTSGSDSGIDLKRSSEEVLGLLLHEETLSGDQVKDGTEMFKHDLHQFILKKRETLPKHSVDLLNDSIGNGSRSMVFSKDKISMPRVDQIAHSGEECGKVKWKINIQDDKIELQKHISASMDTDYSNRILPEDPSGSRKLALELNSEDIELQNQISDNPTAENGMETLQEHPYGYGKQFPQPPQHDGKEHQFLKQISSPLAVDSGSGILQEDISGFGEQSDDSNQRNDKKLQFLKQISAAPDANIGKETLQVLLSRFGQQSLYQNGELKLVQEFPDSQTADNGKAILQENPSGSGLQSPLQNGELQLLQQIPATQAADNGKEILHDYLCGSGQLSHQQNALHIGLRKLSRSGSTVYNNVHALELSIMPLPPSDKNKEIHASGSCVIADPLLRRRMIADSEVNVPKAPSDGNGCLDPSLITYQKNQMFYDEKQQRSHTPNQDFMNEDKTENGLCLKCDKGGSLLICRGSSCPVAVHDKCIDSSVDFDEKGNFYCPVCSYTRAALAYCGAKKRYSQAKKALTSFINKDSVRCHQERVSQPAIPRETHQLRMVGNMKYHGKHKICQRNTKTLKHHKQKKSIVHRTIGNLPGTAEASQNVTSVDISCNSGELDNENPVDDHECIMQRQTHAAVVLDNGKVPCNFVHVDVDIPPLQVMPLSVAKNGTVKGCQGTELMKHQKALTHKDRREGCPRARGQQITEANATPDNSNLACEVADTCRSKEILVVPLANVKCETFSVETNLETQKKRNQEHVKDGIKQNIDNLHYRKAVGSVTTERCAKRRKSKMQIDNEIADGCQRTRAVKNQITEANGTADTVNLTCKERKASGIREARALSQVTVPIDKFSEIQNQKHQEQATCVVEQETHSPANQSVVASALSNERYAKKKRLHTAITQNQHPHLSTKYQIGGPSFGNGSKGQNESNYEPYNRRARHYWTPEEEKALKDAMQNNSLNNGNVPWAKIWKTIRHIFREARQPSDLKDKWRNIMMKEARERKKGVKVDPIQIIRK